MQNIREFLWAATDGILAVDLRQRITFWNQAATRLLGWQPQEVLGRHCFELLGGVQDDGSLLCRRQCCALNQSSRGETPPICEIRTSDRMGQEIWLCMTTLPVPSSWRESSVLVHMFRDVSARKNLERGLLQLLSQLSAIGAPGAQPGHGDSLRPGALNPLSSRETEILSHLASGASNRRTAQALFISEATVRNHVHRILEKFGVHTRLEAVILGLRHGLVSSDGLEDAPPPAPRAD